MEWNRRNWKDDGGRKKISGWKAEDANDVKCLFLSYCHGSNVKSPSARHEDIWGGGGYRYSCTFS
jgi:hypothetical protein